MIDKFGVAGKLPDRSCLPQYFTSAMLGCACAVVIGSNPFSVRIWGRKRKTQALKFFAMPMVIRVAVFWPNDLHANG